MKEYTEKFYRSLRALIDKEDKRTGGYHSCKGCGVLDGEKLDGTRRAIVRLAVNDPNKPASDARNIGFFCTRCRKGPRERIAIPKRVRKSWPKLFKRR